MGDARLLRELDAVVNVPLRDLGSNLVVLRVGIEHRALRRATGKDKQHGAGDRSRRVDMEPGLSHGVPS
jgi:hypothetical protein